jgi:GT2 family glycosyltransferase
MKLSDQSMWAVIVVCWNNETLLADCLDSIRAQTIDASRVIPILVDNDSADDSVAFVRKNYPEVDVIEVGHNSGFSHANNVGIRRAFQDPNVAGIVMLNSDARLEPNWLETITKFASTRPKVASLQSLTVDHHNQSVIDSHHLYVTRSLHATQFLTGTPVDRTYTSQRIFGVNAAAALYTRAFLEAQPFDDFLDETMGMYLEDVDLAARALVMGWESWFVAGTRASHIGSASSKKRSGGFSLRQTWRNQPVMLLTNFPVPVLLRGLRGFLTHELGAIRHLRATGQPELVSEILRGRRDGLRLIRYALGRRKTLKQHRVVEADLLWELMNTGTIIS